ncbi:MAG: iron-containing alcohol dehydrogenase [Pyramidobacter sp.]|nr:iron-containing alcohol dehydrogenase [Pyramidobacter sp.]
MINFEYYTPTKIAFGRGVESRTGELARAFGAHKALIHYGGKSALASGLIGRIKASLDAAGVAHVELGGVVPNPHLGKVREGIELAKREGVDFLIAVGGGSVIDSAKAIGYGAAEPDHDVWELYDDAGTRKPAKCLPIGAVLTIAAAGSEMSNSSVITDEKTGLKRSCKSDLSRPRFAVMDPELTVTLPDFQTQSGCADILMHTMERWFNASGTLELTDAIAAGLMKTVMKNARILRDHPDCYEARAEVMWASSLSHNGLTGCGSDGGDWAVHKIEHELGGMFDVTHGAGLAAVWGSWARYVLPECPKRFAEFAVQVMGVAPAESDEATARAGIEAVEDYYRSVGMPTNLRELGVSPTEQQITRMAESAASAGGGRIGVVRRLDANDIAAIYRAAL